MISPSKRRLWILLGISWSLSAAFADVAFSLLPAPADSSTLSAVGRYVLVDTGIFAVVFAVTAGPALSVLRQTGSRRIAIALTVASAVAAALIVGSPYNRLTSYFDCQPTVLVCQPYIVRFVAPIGVVCAAMFGIANAFNRELDCADMTGDLSAAAAGAPLLACMALLGIWSTTYTHAFTGLPGLILLLGIGAPVTFASVVVSRSAVRRRRPFSVSGALLVVIAIVASMESFPTTAAPRALNTSKSTANRPLAAPPTVLLITIDALRADALSCYGDDVRRTPNIDGLASDGVVFENAVAPASWTAPAVPSILTGLDPQVLDVGMLTAMPPNVPTLAERLSDVGYETVAIVTNPLLGVDSGVARGFDDYRVVLPPLHTNANQGGSLAGRLRRFLARRRSAIGTVIAKTQASSVTNAAIEVLRTPRNRPVFLWLHYLDVHIPYAPPDEYLPDGVAPGSTWSHFMGEIVLRTPDQLRIVKGLYQGEVRYVDHSVGTLLDAMKRLGVYEKALIVLTADHGEEHWEHGVFEHGPHLYRESLHVPLIVKGTSVSRSTRVSRVVGTESLTPTVLALARVPYDSTAMQAAALNERADFNEDDERPILSVTANAGLGGERRMSLIFSGFKYIASMASGHEELYDLVMDPEELHSIAERSPDIIARAHRLLSDRLAEGQRMRERYHISATPRRTDAETIDRLRALGYIH